MIPNTIELTNYNWASGYKLTFSNVPPIPNRPLAIIMGWMGSKPRQLRHYNKLYEDHGFETISFTCPTLSLIAKRKTCVRRFAKGLIHQYLEQIHVEKKPQYIVLHCFSNGGYIVFLEVVAELMKHTSDIQDLVLASIFDSCPALYSTPFHAIIKSYKALHYSLASPILKKLFFLLCWSPGLIFTIQLIRFFLQPKAYPPHSRWLKLLKSGIIHLCVIWCITGYRIQQFWIKAKEHPLISPELYLMSEGDDITDHQNVKLLIQQRQERGIEVDSYCWKKSGHVTHMKNHKEKYEKTVFSFIKKCLQNRSMSRQLYPQKSTKEVQKKYKNRENSGTRKKLPKKQEGGTKEK